MRRRRPWGAALANGVKIRLLHFLRRGELALLHVVLAGLVGGAFALNIILDAGAGLGSRGRSARLCGACAGGRDGSAALIGGALALRATLHAGAALVG